MMIYITNSHRASKSIKSVQDLISSKKKLHKQSKIFLSN